MIIASFSPLGFALRPHVHFRVLEQRDRLPGFLEALHVRQGHAVGAEIERFFHARPRHRDAFVVDGRNPHDERLAADRLGAAQTLGDALIAAAS